MPWTRPTMPELNRTATIQLGTETVASNGDVTVAYAGTDTRKVRYDWQSGEEVTLQDGRTATVTCKLAFRYYPGLSVKHVLIIDSVQYDILSIDDWQLRKQWHICKCEVVV